MGGLIGDTLTEAKDIKNSYNKGKVVGNTNYVGGIVGLIRSKIENCYNSGNVEIKSENDSIGALFGALDAEINYIKNCYYLETTYNVACGNEANIEEAHAITSEELKKLASSLGEEYKENNEGDMYPKLKWE